MVSVFHIWDLYITTSIESIAAPGRLFSIFNISLRALDVLFIALSAILRDSIRQSYWNACIHGRIRCLLRSFVPSLRSTGRQSRSRIFIPDKKRTDPFSTRLIKFFALPTPADPLICFRVHVIKFSSLIIHNLWKGLHFQRL